jgi:hypothetical protein
MSNVSATRVAGATAIVGGVVALVGNALGPRFNDDDVVVYRKIAHSTRFTVSGVIVLVAVLLVTAAMVGFARSAGSSEFAYYGRLAAVVGGSLAILQTGAELYGYKQQAEAFASANDHNVVSAFWATNAMDHLSSSMFAVWTLVLLGIAPALIAAAFVRSRGLGPVASMRLGAVGLIGGLVCIVVGVGSLLHGDQSVFDIPFAIGSVLVTIWVIGTGVVLWRTGANDMIDVSEPAPQRQRTRA